MIKVMMLIIAIVCFIYGVYALATGKIVGKEIWRGSEKNKQYYAKICGIVMLVEAVIMGIGFYMEIIGLPYSSLVFIFAIGALVAVLMVAKKLLSK